MLMWMHTYRFIAMVRYVGIVMVVLFAQFISAVYG